MVAMAVVTVGVSLDNTELESLTDNLQDSLSTQRPLLDAPSLHAVGLLEDSDFSSPRRNEVCVCHLSPRQAQELPHFVTPGVTQRF